MTRKPKSQVRHAEHKILGPGELISVRQLDAGALVADVRFGDGTTRCIRLAQQYWTSPIAELLPTPPPRAKRVRKLKAEKAMVS